VKREVRAVLLVLFGTAALRLSLFSDNYVRYVREYMRPYLITGGLVLVALGLAGAFSAVRAQLQEPAKSEHQDEQQDGYPDEHQPGHQGEDDGHGHAHGGPRSAWLLILPVLAIFLIAPPALGSYTAQRSANAVAKPAAAAFPALPTGDPLVMPLNDFDVRAVWDDSGALKGRRVKLTGFVTPKKGGGWYVSRLTISCCAADALTYKVEVRGAPAPPTDSWVQITGVWRPGGPVKRDDAIPALNAQQVTGIAQPHNPYE
jgi:uncharacterized repeat protein (TIGR03943 family)